MSNKFIFIKRKILISELLKFYVFFFYFFNNIPVQDLWNELCNLYYPKL